MITKEQALTANEFHYDHFGSYIVGPRGRMKFPRIETWRRNGRTQIWKTRPTHFRVPVKFGLYNYASITPSNAYLFHTAEDCPLNAEGTGR